VQSGGSKVMAMTLTMTLRNLVKEKKRVRVSTSPSLALPWIGTASCRLERSPGKASSGLSSPSPALRDRDIYPEGFGSNRGRSNLSLGEGKR
jgi:hypothetical protein